MTETAYLSEAVRAALEHWFPLARSARCEPWTAHSGLSGASLWKVVERQHVYCLRRWPARRPTRQQLLAIHRLMGHLHQARPQLIPRLIPTRAGETLVSHDDQMWELATWMPGAACRDTRISPAQLRAAMQTLAQLHHVAEGLQATPPAASRGISPGLARRSELAQALLGGDLAVLDRAVKELPATAAFLAIRRSFDPLRPALASIAGELETAARLQLDLQWRLGDVHREHILFVGDRVSGVLDFGAAGIDSPMGDVARLLGSIAGDEQRDWRDGLAAYEEIRPLSDHERRALAAFDAGGLCASVANWARWLAIERRELASPNAIEVRLQALAGRLEALNSRGRASVIDWERH